MNHRHTAAAHIGRLIAIFPEHSELFASLVTALEADETLMKGTPTIQERALSSAALCDALSAILKAFVDSGVELPDENEGDELTRVVGRVLAN